MNLQETTPKQDILGEAMKCINGEDSNLQILLNEITDFKAKIESLGQQKIQIIVFSLRNTFCKM